MRFTFILNLIYLKIDQSLAIRILKKSICSFHFDGIKISLIMRDK